MIELQTLRKTLHQKLYEHGILESNEEDILKITEEKNSSSKTPLKEITIKSMPTDECWIFDNENSNTQFIAQNSSKVEKTIIYLSDKKINIIFIEMKSGLTAEILSKCKEKLESSLALVSTYLATLDHSNKAFNNYKFNFNFVIFYNKYKIKGDEPDIDKQICKEFISAKNQFKDNFLTHIESSIYGMQRISTKVIYEKNAQSIITDFKDINIGSSKL